MTVQELKETLNDFPEHCVVLVSNGRGYTRAEHVEIGFNELDACVIIDDYIEEEEIMTKGKKYSHG